jgi:hypothetical protein
MKPFLILLFLTLVSCSSEEVINNLPPEIDISTSTTSKIFSTTTLPGPIFEVEEISCTETVGRIYIRTSILNEVGPATVRIEILNNTKNDIKDEDTYDYIYREIPKGKQKRYLWNYDYEVIESPKFRDSTYKITMYVNDILHSQCVTKRRFQETTTTKPTTTKPTTTTTKPTTTTTKPEEVVDFSGLEGIDSYAAEIYSNSKGYYGNDFEITKVPLNPRKWAGYIDLSPIEIIKDPLNPRRWYGRIGFASLEIIKDPLNPRRWYGSMGLVSLEIIKDPLNPRRWYGRIDSSNVEIIKSPFNPKDFNIQGHPYLGILLVPINDD